MPKKLDTTAQAEAAEVRTVAELLNRGLIAGQYPRSYPRIDVYAFHPEVKRLVNIQVKYRHASNASDVTVKKLDDAAFLVLYRANKGPAVGGRSEMQTWVIPANQVESSKVRFAQLDDQYLQAWSLIEEACRAH